MPPKGKSKALAQKHSYLGKFTKNACKFKKKQKLIQNQETELELLKEEISVKQKESSNIQKEIT